MEKQTACLHLQRRDPARNMQRFYRVAITEDLFGCLLLERQWGRIGTRGRVKLEPVVDMTAALERFSVLERSKRRRGYRELDQQAKGGG